MWIHDLRRYDLASMYESVLTSEVVDWMTEEQEVTSKGVHTPLNEDTSLSPSGAHQRPIYTSLPRPIQLHVSFVLSMQPTKILM